MSDPASKKTLMRSLGEFVGHIVKGVKTDTGVPDARRTVVSHHVEEQTQHTPTGKMILRRSTIEEIEIIEPTGHRAGQTPPSAGA